MTKRKVVICYNHKQDKLYKDIVRTWPEGEYELFVDTRPEDEKFDSAQALSIKNALTNNYLMADAAIVIIAEDSENEKWMKWEMEMIRKTKMPVAIARVHTSFVVPEYLKKFGYVAKSFTPEAVFRALEQAISYKRRAEIGKG